MGRVIEANIKQKERNSNCLLFDKCKAYRGINFFAGYDYEHIVCVKLRLQTV